MKKNAILYISAILLVTASCSIKETPILEESPVQRNKIVTLVATLSPKGGNETKALTDPGDGTLSATWAINEEICVEYTNESDDFVDAKAIVTDVDGSGKATITVNLVNPKDGNSDIYFHYPYTIAKGIKENKLDQNGTLDDIATNFDDLTGEGTLNVSGGIATLPSSVAMTRNVCVWKFIFTDGSSPITNNITALNIKVGAIKEYDITPYSQSAIYVALTSFSSQDITITAATPTGIYAVTKSGISVQNGKFYQSTVALAPAVASSTYRVYSDRTNFDNVAVPGSAIPVTSSMTNWASGTYIVNSNVTIDGNVTFGGDVDLILCDGAELTVNGVFGNYNSLNIYGQDLSTGKLTVVNDDINVCMEDLNIHGGIITVTDGGVMQGIETGGTFNIYHGTVSVAGAVNGFMVMGDMHIYGGNVYAESTGGAALQVYGAGVPGSLTVSGGSFTAIGIGSGSYNKGILVEDGYGNGTATITISGGEVRVRGGMSSGSESGANAIDVCGNLIISGNANLSVQGGMDVSGQGGGYGINVRAGSSAGGNATISGGTTRATAGDGMVAINVDSDLTISGNSTEIDAAGGRWMEGILAGSSITINGGTITAQGGEEGGIGLEGNTILNGGTVKAIGGYGILGSMENGGAGYDGALVVNGGCLIATGGEKAGAGTDGHGISDGSTIFLAAGIVLYEGDSDNPTTPAADQSACTKRYVKIQ